MAYRGKIPPVPIPDKSDAGRSFQAKNYVYWVTEAHRDPVSHRSVDDRKIIGRITDYNDTLMWPNENYRMIFSSTNDDDRTHENILAVGPYIAVIKAADKMGIMAALKKAFPTEWPRIIALCVQWIDLEENVSQCFEYWFYDNFCGYYTAMDPSTISRFYETIGLNSYQRNFYRKSFNEEYRKHFAVSNSHSDSKQKKRIVGCDATNYNHHSKSNELAGYGKAKDDPDVPIYGTMSYVDEATGMTMFAHLFPGSLLDKTEIMYALESSLSLGVKDLHMMFDRGFLSEKFISYFITLKKNYNITFSASCPATFGFVKEMIQKYGSSLRNASKYYISCENIYGMKLPDVVSMKGEGITQKDMKSMSVYLFYDDIRASQEKQAIQDKINQFQTALEQRKNYTQALVKCAAPYFDVKQTKRDPQTGRSFLLIRKNDVIQCELDNAGFFMSMSNGTESPEEEIVIIRLRDKSEKSYCRRKSFFSLETPGTGTYDSFLGKMFVADVAQNVEEALEYYCKPYLSAKRSTTLRTMVSELHKCKAHINEDGTMRL